MHVLAAYITSKPPAVLEELLALCLTVLGCHQALATVIFLEMEDKLTNPLCGALVIAGVGLSFNQYKRLLYYMGKDSHDPWNWALCLAAGTSLFKCFLLLTHPPSGPSVP